MNELIVNFDKEISSLRNFAHYTENVIKDLSKTSLSYQYVISKEKKNFDYRALIISLYGILESYVELLLIRYLETSENEILKYEDLKKTIVENHYRYSIALTQKLFDNKYNKYNHLDKNDIVKNLHNCISKNTNYTINKEAFTIPSGNLKHEKICDLLKLLGINLDQELRSSASFKSRAKSDNVFNKVDDLVERRNIIAHGIPIIDRLDVSEIISYIDFIDTYYHEVCMIANSDLINEVLKFKTSDNTQTQKIVVKRTYPGNIIGCEFFSFPQTNSTIIIKRGDTSFIEVKILQKNTFPQTNEMTLKLDKNLKSSYTYYVKL